MTAEKGFRQVSGADQGQRLFEHLRQHSCHKKWIGYRFVDVDTTQFTMNIKRDKMLKIEDLYRSLVM